MKHLGDITKIRGYDVPAVDCVIGGSPCQDLSVAGKRAGLNGERSGLFMEQIRIIKEMREQDAERNRADGRADYPVRPRYMVWENVPGAFSSNKGEDFRVVLEETARVADESAVIPGPPQGKWRNSGCVMGDGWSIAWRVLDAQFWGVPQRRRRIALVTDFGGQSAPEILFECKSLSRDSEQSSQKGKGTSEGTEGSAFCTKCYGIGSYYSNAWQSDNPNSGVYEADTAKTLDALNCGYPACNQGGIAVVQGFDGYNQAVTGDVAMPLRNKAADADHIPCVFDARGNGDGKTVCTITGDYENCVTDYTALCIGNGQVDRLGMLEKVGALNCMHDQQAVMQKQSVRRLTPLECERLQGFPDGWTDIGEWADSNGKKRQTTDSARYKALGNSIALPPWKWVLKRLSACYERNATMASLFDGIGGFPLIWEQLNGKGSCLWASEIEEFPIAVTKKRIGGDD